MYASKSLPSGSATAKNSQITRIHHGFRTEHADVSSLTLGARQRVPLFRDTKP